MHPFNTVKLNISVLNTNGLGDKSKRLKLFEYFKGEQGIILLQETHSLSDTIDSWQSELRLGKLASSHGTSNSRGVITASGITENVPIFSNGNNSWSDDDGRIVATLHQHRKITYGIVNLYAPNLNTTSSSTETYLNFLDKVENAIEQVDVADVLIVAGDFNLIFDQGLDAQGGKRVVHKLCIERWNAIKEKFLLRDIFRENNPQKPLFTWDPMNKRAMRRRLDYMLVRGPTGTGFKTSTPMRLAFSDHAILSCKITVPAKDEKGPGYWRHNAMYSKDPIFISKLQAKLVSFKENEETRYINPHMKWEAAKQIIREFSMEYSKGKVKERLALKHKLQKHLEKIQNRCYEDPSNNLFSSARAEIQNQLDKLLYEEAKATIFRSKVKYVEEGEKCTKFFFQQIKRNNANANIDQLRIGDSLTQDPTAIRKHATEFYSNLYKAKKEENVSATTEFLSHVQGLLPPHAASIIDRRISRVEVAKALKSMKSGKSPGNDGITVDLYQALWPVLDDIYLEMLTYSLRIGKLPPSMRQSVIKLLHKKDRDPKDITSYRPISLMNYDAKIFSKLMANRIVPYLKKLLSDEQLGFVGDRYIGEGILTAELLMEKYAEQNEGLFVNLDFFKAFDTIDHSYLQAVLHKMGFGENFIGMLKTLYFGAESTVMLQGLTGGYFQLERSCRQGCCLSPYLFILALEPLLRTIKASSAEGLSLGSSVVKFTAYADDVTLFLKNRESLTLIENILQKFFPSSGLQVNKNKSEVLLLGNYSCNLTNFRVVEELKITGVHVGYDCARVNAANFQSPLQKLKNNLSWWKSRSLSLLGKALVTKAHGLSVLNYIAGNAYVPPKIVKEVESEIYRFVWGMRDWVKRDVLAKSFDEGGISLSRFSSTIASGKIQWLRRAETSSAPWAEELLQDFSVFGGLSLFRGPIHQDLIPLLKHSRSKEIVRAWNTVACPPKGSDIGLINVHFSSNICTAKGSSLHRPNLIQKGFFQVSHFFDENGKILSWEKASSLGLRMVNFLDFRAIVAAIPPVFKEQMKSWHAESYDNRWLGVWDINADFHDLQKLSPKLIKSLINLKNVDVQPSFRNKMSNWLMTDSDWKHYHKQVTKLFWSSKLRSFQYKLLTGVLFSRADMYLFKFIESEDCPFCSCSTQTLKHLFVECPKVIQLRGKLSQFFPGLWNERDFSERMCYLGSTSSSKNDNTNAREFLTVLINRFIYVCNYSHDIPLSLPSFLSFIKGIQDIEMDIALRKGRSLATLQRWDFISGPLLPGGVDSPSAPTLHL